MSSISNNTNRVAGLISGLETEDLVKAMSANTKNRINSKKQKLQTLQWKQDSYRSIIDKIAEFKNKYLRIDAEKSIKANKVMKKCQSTSSNDKVITAAAAAGAVAGKYIIKEASKATTASFSTNGAAAEGSIKLDFSKAAAGKDYKVTVNLDGADKTIVFKGGKDEAETKANFLEAANSAFEGIKKDSQTFEFKNDSWLVFNSGSDGIYHTFGVGHNSEGVGLDFDTSSKILTNSKLGSIGFAQQLKSESGNYNININGVSFQFDNDTTIADMMDEINNSDAGVKMSFSNVSQSFTFETKDTGVGQEIQLYQTDGNLLNALLNKPESELGVSSADSAKIEYKVNESFTQAIGTDLKGKLTGGFDTGDDSKLSLALNIDGTDYNLELDLSSLTKKADDKTYTENEINAALSLALDVANETVGNDVKLTYSGGSLTIKSDKKVTIGANELTLEEGKSNEKTVVADENYTLVENDKDLTFKFLKNGKDFTFNINGDIKIRDLVDSGLFTLRNDGTLVANAEIEGGDDFTNELLTKYFGKTKLSPAAPNDTLTAYGTNSTLVLSSDGENFTTYTSATNTFTFDGTTINVSNAKDFKAESEEDYVTVETTKDTSALKDLIKEFVADYNKLLEDLYGEVDTARPKSKGSYFDPLTEEQEEDMKDEEIEKWNESAKKGLLYRDSSVTKFLGEIRGAMNTFVDKFGLYNIGVKLTDNWRDNGKLEIDEDKLETAINANGDKLAELFTSENGIAAKLEKVIDKAISTKSKNYGYLTSLAGQKNTKTDTDNQIYKQMQSIQDIIDKLEEKYENEQERYWNQFTALEKYMAQMQQQQSYFTQGSM